MVIFDLDGTLYQTHRVTVAAARQAASQLDLQAPGVEAISALMGSTGSDFCEQLLPGSNAELRREFGALLSKFERRLIPKAARLYPGIEELLATLSDQGTELAICSNGSADYIKAVLQATGIAGHFKHEFGAMTGRSKTEALAELNCLSASEPTVYIGDRSVDLQAARSNAIPFIGVSYGYGAASELEQADYCAGSAGELLGYINRWQVFSQIESESLNKQIQRPLIIGISGVDTAGKTRFAQGLATCLAARDFAVELIQMDDFHNPREQRQLGKDPQSAYFENAFNLDLLEREILHPLRKKGRLDTRLKLLDLNLDTFTIDKHWRIEPSSIVIIEGTLLLRPPTENYLDYVVHLEISFDEVIRRAKSRDARHFGSEVEQRYRTKYIPIQQRYLREHDPVGKADLEVNNEDFEHPKIIGR